MRAFFDTLPLALVRDNTEVVHAAWQAESVAKLKALPEGVGLVEAFGMFAEATAAQIKEEGIKDEAVIDLMEQVSAGERVGGGAGEQCGAGVGRG